MTKFCPSCGQTLTSETCPICSEPAQELEWTPEMEEHYIKSLSSVFWERLFWWALVIEAAVGVVGIIRRVPSMIITGFGMVCYLAFIRKITTASRSKC